MQRDFFDPSWEETSVVLITPAIFRKAERLLESCEACNSDTEEFPFDHVLDQVTGNDPGVTDYLLAEAAHCPRCRGEIREKTLVEWGPDGDATHYANPAGLVACR